MKVLIAIDQTPSSGEIVRSVLNREWYPNTQFRVLTVIEPLPLYIDDFKDCKCRAAAKNLDEQRIQAADRMLREARTLLMYKLPDAIVHTDLRNGNAHDQILNAAIDWMPDKIIIGSHGSSPNRLFPGSLSHSIASQSVASVELVRLSECGPMVPARKPGCAAERITALH